MLRYCLLPLLLVASIGAVLPPTSNKDVEATTKSSSPAAPTLNPLIKAANKVADSIVSAVDTALSTISVTELGPFEIPLKKNSTFVLELDHCKLSKGPYLRRTADCTVDTTTANPVLRASLEWDSPSLDCHWELLIYDGFLQVNTSQTIFNMEVMFNSSTVTPVVNNKTNALSLSYFANVDVGFNGMITLDSLLQGEIKNMINNKKDAIEFLSAVPLSKALETIIKKILNPLG